MGYETTIHIIEPYSSKQRGSKKNPKMGSTICSIELSCCGSGPFNKVREASVNRIKKSGRCWAIWASDGDTKVVSDCYGSPLGAIPIEDAIKVLEEELTESWKYRRFQIARAALKEIARTFGPKVMVLTFGH